MNANETDFGFLKATLCLEIPYFQRGYVWNKDNWEELLENLLDDKQSHFLGSIILKQLDSESGSVPRWSVIDGQQRLTTLCILFKACYDTLPMDTYDEEAKKYINSDMENILFFRGRKINSQKEIKIMHSLVDAPDYKKIVLGDAKDLIDEIVLESEKINGRKVSSNILQCYKYFYLKLRNNTEYCVKLWEDLLDEQKKIIVKIDLDISENEQAIFDTVNSAGVRLTCADTIKNALFQKANENANTEYEKKNVIELYNNVWGETFANSSETIEYWSRERKIGRLTRDNLEVLLHCIALIKGLYDPELNKISDLPQVYKKYVANFNKNQIKNFLLEIKEYALIYRKFFYSFDKTTLFQYDNDIQRLFHVLSVCEVSTLHPFILKLFKDYSIANEHDLPLEFKEEINKIEKYVLRHAVCRVSTKNFNKVCALLIAGKTTIDKENAEKQAELGDGNVKESLKNLCDNRIGALVLFWIELKRRYLDGLYDEQELKYVDTLEHIMPQKWEEFWTLDKCPVINVNDNSVISDEELAKEIRYNAVYELGNMTLLNGKLNTSLRNYEIGRKVLGENKKKGIKAYARLSVAKEIVETYETEHIWNEMSIRKRTEKLTNEFLSIW